MIFTGKTDESLHLETIDKLNYNTLKEAIESSLTILWFRSNNNKLTIDGNCVEFQKNQIVFLTEFHKVKVNEIEDARFLRFNQAFYCILDHDLEVGCKGSLFFGASKLPTLQIPDDQVTAFETIWTMFNSEMISADILQIDMLRTLLKSYLISCARIYKTQNSSSDEKEQLNIIREFSYLVEQHFKTKHTVACYASLLNRSPKTLSNTFSKAGFKNPLQYIQERRGIEAKRLLLHTNMQVKEIAFEIGYENVQSFSRFFKSYESITPTQFKENLTRVS